MQFARSKALGNGVPEFERQPAGAPKQTFRIPEVENSGSRATANQPRSRHANSDSPKSLTIDMPCVLALFMADATGISADQDRALARLLELGLAAAEKVQARLMATEDDALVGELSLALNRVSRNVRQTIALQMKVARDRGRHERDETAAAAKAREARVSRRRAQVRAAVEGAVWAEAEGDETAERLIDDLDDRLTEEALYDDFDVEPVAVHIARLCEELGLPVSPEVSLVGEMAQGAGEGAAAGPQREGSSEAMEGTSAPPWRSSA